MRAGAAAAEFVADNLASALVATPAWQTGARDPDTLGRALTQTCLTLDQQLFELPTFQVRMMMIIRALAGWRVRRTPAVSVACRRVRSRRWGWGGRPARSSR
jgi:hypothetical protein